MTVAVLVYSSNSTLADLIERNLARRGFEVYRTARLPASGEPGPLPHPIDVVVADLDSSEQHVWRGAARLRVLFPTTPLVLLAHDWPSGDRLRALGPCRYVRKPFAIHDLLAALRTVAASAT